MSTSPRLSAARRVAASGFRRLDRLDAVLEELTARASVALERELDVLRSHRVAVVEPDALTKYELVNEPVGGHRPRLGQAGCHEITGHRLHQRVMEPVERHERRDDPGGLRGVEPGGRERNVDTPRHLTFRRRGARRDGNGWH